MKDVQTAKAIPQIPSIDLGQAAALAETVIKDTTANPAPLGLMGFGLTTVLLNLHNAGIIGIGSMILAMGLFYGGLAQIIAGVMEWKKKNTFGMVAFTSYGFFWISLVALIVMPRFGIADASDKNAMAAYLFIWGLFSIVLFIATLKMNRTIMLVFFALVVLFILLGLGDATGNATITRIAGYEGIACGLGAIYLGAAQILNEVYGRKVLPIGEL
ncbi:GPR1/FUN34/yaaH family protein [Anaeromyxobacter dehalogenans 2CP-1]|uniref:GPR1/FUN34/yaaH family protein n=1 Tax=Anaeromyxobacter dehalogenans (strain ATCC BAA-258 / DSM 21875 / 2CP-1) TaxID=455488 RepID=B8JDM0_ANAD2|nr:GPR1/FUN34/YaaH family transporter [Anaeromyxobacter dehalogenans]ACL64115.1 GPR1/FUN34/yaaH family protein [Anaeromyxobacter dehalogenans 2CP-1]